MFTKYLEHDFIFGDNQVFREYDMTGFAVNASNALRTNNDVIYNLNFDFYISMINKAISHLVPLTIDQEKAALIKKYGRNHQIDVVGGQVKELIDPNTIVLKPGYLNEMLDNIGIIIDKAMKGSASKDEIKRHISSEMTMKVKRQVVRSNLPYDASKKAMLTMGAPNMVPFTVKYVSAYPTEFISDWETYKKKMIIEATDVINTISSVKANYSNYMRALDTIKVDTQWDNKKSDHLYYISFNAMRNLLEVVSFLSYMTIRKVGIVANDIVRSNEILDRIYTLFVSPMVESVLDNLIEKNDSKTLGEELSLGKVSAFDELSVRVYDYHKSIYEGSPFDDIRQSEGALNVPLDLRLDQTEYDNEVYEDVKDMYGVIQQGLATVSANCDDYMVVFDDILDKSGFVTPLEDRFAGTLDKIEDLSEYESSTDISSGVSPEMYVYYRMMREVRDYTNNMAAVGELSKQCNDTLNELIHRFDNNINTEYKNTLTIKEASDFLASLKDQMDGLNISVASKFMLRLKNIAICLEKFDKDKSSQLQNNAYQVESTVLERSILTYSEKTQEMITDLLFEAMVESYTLARQKRDMGIDFIVTESKVKDLAIKIKAVLVRWYEKVSQKIKGLMNGPRALADKQFLTKNVKKILSGSFSNKTSPIEIIEYEKLAPAENMTKDVKSLVKKTSSINLQPDKLKTVTDEESAASILFGSRPPASVWTDGNAARNIAKFYKCGEYDEKPVLVKNGDLKTMVEDAAKYCGDFYSKFLPTINDNINLIKDNITNNLENLMKESAIESLIGNMFTEADEEKKEGDDAPKEYQSMDKAAKADDKKKEEEKPSDANNTSSTDNSQQSGGNTSGTTAADATSSSSSDTSGSSSTPAPSSSDTSKSSTPVEDAKTVSDTAKKVEMLQRMVQQYCNGILTAAFDRYKDYMNLLKGLAGEGTEQINSSTDKPQEEPSSEENNNNASGDTGNSGNETETNNNEENQEGSTENNTETNPEESSQDQSQEQQPAEQSNAGTTDDSASVDETGLYS